MRWAQQIDGRAQAAAVKKKVSDRVVQLRLRGVQPGLAVLLVGDNPASQVYVRNKTRACEDVGIRTFDVRLPADSTFQQVRTAIEQCAQDPQVHGILLQLPLPVHLNAELLLDLIPPHKDVDGLTPENLGRLFRGTPRMVPCTPLGVLHLIRSTGVELRGKRAVVVGRSPLVGRPTAALLLAADATVSLAHAATIDLPDLVSQAEILVVAIGKPQFLQADWIQQGAVVIDVGINRLQDGTLAGDVAFEAACQRAGYITPVPGGVGPMTVAMLLSNTVDAASQTLFEHRL